MFQHFNQLYTSLRNQKDTHSNNSRKLGLQWQQYPNKLELNQFHSNVILHYIPFQIHKMCHLYKIDQDKYLCLLYIPFFKDLYQIYKFNHQDIHHPTDINQKLHQHIYYYDKINQSYNYDYYLINILFSIYQYRDYKTILFYIHDLKHNHLEDNLLEKFPQTSKHSYYFQYKDIILDIITSNKYLHQEDLVNLSMNLNVYILHHQNYKHNKFSPYSYMDKYLYNLILIQQSYPYTFFSVYQYKDNLMGNLLIDLIHSRILFKMNYHMR